MSFHEKRYNESISFLSYASQYEKNNADINFLFAKNYLQLEKLDDAEYYFKETIRFNSLKKQAYLYLGHLYLIKNNPKRANFYYDVLLTFNPKHFEGNLYRGIASYLSKEYQNAVDFLTVANALQANNYKAKYQLSKSLIKVKAFGKAYSILLELNKEKPTDNRIYYMLLKTAKALKKRKKVKEYKSVIKAIENK